LSYPAVMKRIKPTYCESVSLSETASVVTVGAGDGGPAWFASSWANRLNTDGIIETHVVRSIRDKHRRDGGNPKGLA